jgi:hypothetical protein
MHSNRSMSLVTTGLVLVGSAAFAGQEPPPIPAVTGTIALDGTVQKTYEGLNTVVVKTVDGIEHLFHLTGQTAVHTSVDAEEQTLSGLEAGNRVIVHYTIDGEQETAHEVDRVDENGLKATQGVIMNVDRQTKTMVIRLADGSRQTLELTERAASDVGKDIDTAAMSTTTVVVYYGDEAGRKVAHYFKRVS